MLSDFLVATALALIFLLLSWAWGRETSDGNPLNSFKRKLLAFGFTFVLGMAYIMVLFSDLTWNRTLLFPVIACWGAIVAGVAWHSFRRGKSSSSAP